MTDPSQMPRWAADILRSTCESAAATLAAHGHFDADAAREFVSGLAAGFEVDADDVACALGLDDLELGDAPVGARPPAEDDPPWLDLVEPPPGYQLAAIMAGSPAAHAAGSFLSDLEDAPIGWAWARPGETLVDAAARAEGGAGKGELAANEDAAHAAAWADHQLAADPPGYRVVPCGKGFVVAEIVRVLGVEVAPGASNVEEIAESLRTALEQQGEVERAASIEPRRLTADEARAEAWRRWHCAEVEVLHDMLLLAAIWPEDAIGEQAIARRAWISGWPLRDRGRVGKWAAAVHVHASDHDDVQIPARPACLDVGRPA